MAIARVAEDVEAGVVGAGGGGGGAGGEVTEPLLRRCGKEEDAGPKIRDEAEASECGSEGRLQADDGGSLRMVLVSTAVAVCGSFEFGTCVSPPVSSSSLTTFLFYLYSVLVGGVYSALASRERNVVMRKRYQLTILSGFTNQIRRTGSVRCSEILMRLCSNR